LKEAGEEGAEANEAPQPEEENAQNSNKKPGFLASASNAIVGTINAVKTRFGKNKAEPAEPAGANQEQQDLDAFVSSQGSYG
jgi:hypothetical protein